MIPARVVGTLGVVTALALAPPVFTAVFAMAELLPVETSLLWAASLLVLVVSSALAAGRLRVPLPLVGVLFGLLVVVGVELGARLAVTVVASEQTRAHLAWLANRTYPQFMRARPHPFLQYVGNRQVNNLGFGASHDFERAKPTGTVRIACLGGSTTADGNWPAILETLLAAERERAQEGREWPAFEVMNFAMIGYSSAHVVVDFFLNVVEYDPDYVVLHTGWNDTVFRGRGGDVLSDYSDVFKPFESPDIPDRWLLRSSILYRALRDRSGKAPAWADVAPAIHQDRADTESFDDLDDLIVFRRNLQKMIDFARRRSIELVLTTQPYSTAPGVPNAEEARHLDQCNAIMRELHAANADTTLFVDLDATMTGRFNDHFGDLGHLDPVGREAKARAIGRAILADLGLSTEL